MAIQTLDARGLKCPQPTLKLTTLALKMKPGDIIDIVADCPTFEKDVRDWCARSRKVLLWVRDEENCQRCQIKF
jgi:tRNA 2-thiouridine synthesizing protein A